MAIWPPANALGGLPLRWYSHVPATHPGQAKTVMSHRDQIQPVITTSKTCLRPAWPTPMSHRPPRRSCMVGVLLWRHGKSFVVRGDFTRSEIFSKALQQQSDSLVKSKARRQAYRCRLSIPPVCRRYFTGGGGHFPAGKMDLYYGALKTQSSPRLVFKPKLHVFPRKRHTDFGGGRW